MTLDNTIISDDQVKQNNDNSVLTQSPITESHKSVHAGGFTIVPNQIVNNLTLLPLARLLIIYLISKPPSWSFDDEQFKKYLGCGRDVLEKLFSNLRSEGYVKVVKLLNEKTGQYVGSKRIFARDPIFKVTSLIKGEPNKSAGSNRDPENQGLGDHRGPENRGPENQGLYISNTEVSNIDLVPKKTDHKKQTTVPIQEDVSCINEKFVLEHFALWKFDEGYKADLFATYKLEDLKLAIEYTNSKADTYPGPFFRKCIAEGWHKQSAKPKPSDSVSSQELVKFAEHREIWRDYPLETKLKIIEIAKNKSMIFEKLLAESHAVSGVSGRNEFLTSEFFLNHTVFKNEICACLPKFRKQ